MHEEILTKNQKELLSLLGNFLDSFGLIGGTAIALQIKHRRSIDFDLATFEELDNEKVVSVIRDHYPVEKTIVDEKNELTIVVNEVKLTFIKYPFKIEYDVDFNEVVKMPNLPTLASMKAYSLGRRAKWKDYVDLYFIFKRHTINNVIQKAKEIYKSEFNEKQFREQLSYFEGSEVSNEEIKKTLTETSLQKE